MNLSATDPKPLVLVVEDDEDVRSRHEEGLKDAGCHTIGVATLAEALTSLRDGPAVDLIVTDYHLGRRAPTGGVTLAMSVKAGYDADLPIAMYSGRVGDDELGGVPSELFVLRRMKGADAYAQMKDFNRECHAFALGHRETRIERSRARTQLSGNGQSTPAQVAYKAFDLLAGIDEIEGAIIALGYGLRIISSDVFDDLAATVPVWIRRVGKTYEAQVCGQPYLHWEGPTEEKALRGLVDVMAAFANHLQSLEGKDVDDDLRRLKSFLDSVLEVGVSHWRQEQPQ